MAVNDAGNDHSSWTLDLASMFTYSSDELLSINRDDIGPTRAVRKAIFSLRLWRPRYQRRHAMRLLKRDQELSRTRPLCTGESGLSVACVNSRSIGNKAATLCRTITESNVDVLVITETWHEGSQSSALKRVIPPGYHCVDVARPNLPALQSTPSSSRITAAWQSYIEV